MASGKKEDGGGLAAAYNDLGFKLLALLSEAGAARNVCVSPLGIGFSLAVLFNGAGGKTKQALADALNVGKGSTENFNRANGALRAGLNHEDGGAQVALAAALWADEGVAFDPSFLKVVSRVYDAEARRLDFTSAAAAEAVNEWVSGRTRGKISSVVESGELDEQPSCVLANAVYFKGEWAKKFDERVTREGPFHLQNERQKQVPLMSQVSTHLYHEDGATQFVSLSYSGSRFSACFILPPPAKPLWEFLTGLTAERWGELLGQLGEQRVELTLPRFGLAVEAELHAPLSRLGLGVAFGEGADFGPMGMPGQFISKFKHKMVAEVNEEGTEAAATTAVFMGRSLVGPPRMIVNRPFFWAIRDNDSGALLFAGAVFDPS